MIWLKSVKLSGVTLNIPFSSSSSFSLDESSSGLDNGGVVNSALDFVEEKMFCHHCDGKTSLTLANSYL